MLISFGWNSLHGIHYHGQHRPRICPFPALGRLTTGFRVKTKTPGSGISSFPKNKGFFLMSEYFVQPTTPDNFIIS
jgi:hypothetical protein